MLAQILWFLADGRPASGRFDLSRNKCLRTLETAARSINSAGGAASDFLKTVLSTTAPSLMLNVVITYRDQSFDLFVRCMKRPASLECSTPVTRETSYSGQFRLFKDMHEVREFQLVLCADVFDFVAEYTVRELKQAVEEEKARGGLDYLRYEPLIIFEMRTPRSRHHDWHTGEHTGTSYYLDASAL